MHSVEAATDQEFDNRACPDVPRLLSVAEGYGRWAQTYDLTPNPILALEQRQVLPLLPHLSGRRVLDLACGTGRWLQLFADCGSANCVGIDASRAMLEVAHTKIRSHQLVKGDCCELPFGDSSFAFGMCSFAVSHIEKLVSFAKECARVLDHESHLFITDMHPDAYAAGWRTRFRDQQGTAEIVTTSRHCVEIASVYSANGFRCVSINDFSFGREEEPIFDGAGKRSFFAQARRSPAVLLYDFERTN